MKKIALFAIAAGMLTLSCGQKNREARVMAREVPERADDFVFENNLIAGRFYGRALEGNPTSPGVDIWVKLPGRLVADEWYRNATDKTAPGYDPNYYHRNHGGKDCYKVAVSLGGGASAPLADGAIAWPSTNYRSSEILEASPDRVVFVLHYPAWKAGDATVSLDKKVTVVADSYFCQVEDTYTSDAGSVTVAAGIFRHPEAGTIEVELSGEGCYAVWEHASDQSVEPEDGMIGVAVVMPGADSVAVIDGGRHGACVKTVRSGEPLEYSFGSCWSKGDIKQSGEWFSLVRSQCPPVR